MNFVQPRIKKKKEKEEKEECLLYDFILSHILKKKICNFCLSNSFLKYQAMPTLSATHENRVTNLFRAIFCTEQI